MTVYLPLSGQISRFSAGWLGDDGQTLSTLPVTNNNPARYVRHGVDSPEDSSYWASPSNAGGTKTGWFYVTHEQVNISPTGTIEFKIRANSSTGSVDISNIVLWLRKEVNPLIAADVIIASGSATRSVSSSTMANYTLNLDIVEANRTAFESGIPFYPTVSGLLSFGTPTGSGAYKVPEMNLNLSGTVPSINSNFPLFINGHATSSGDIPLFIFNSVPVSGDITLFEQGHILSSGSIPLYIAGPIEVSGNVPLYIGGLSSGDSNIPLYIHGALFSNSGIDLFIHGYANDSGYMNLYLQGALGTSINNQMPLWLYSTTNSGLFKTMDLFLKQTSQVDPQNVMNLVLGGPSSISVTSYLNLVLENTQDEVASGLSLFLGNYWSVASGYVPLYMRGPVGTDGAVPFSGTMNLYMARDFNGLAFSMPLFLKNYDYSSGNPPLYIFGANLADSSVPLYVRGQDGSPNNDIPLFTSGF